jgi:two-component system chemotaxis response regulator CheY
MADYNILIVEDSPTMRQLISFALKRIRGVRIVEASDGVDGLKKISAEKFQMIFTDINMPVMDGLKLISLVREDANHKGIPIVVITTEGAQEDRQRALALGANDYITKPIQPNRILEVARQLLHLRSVAAAAVAVSRSQAPARPSACNSARDAYLQGVFQ